MSGYRRQREKERKERLHRAEDASETVEVQGSKVQRQLSLVEKLSEGWRRVHEVNHLAQIFRDQGKLG